MIISYEISFYYLCNTVINDIRIREKYRTLTVTGSPQGSILGFLSCSLKTSLKNW